MYFLLLFSCPSLSSKSSISPFLSGYKKMTARKV